MALATLATTADITSRGVVVAPEETALVDVALDVASAAVRAAAGSAISESTDTVLLEGDCAARLKLPGAPVSAVATVLLDGVPVTDWKLRSGALWRSCGWQSGDAPSEVSVTYTHGLPAVPTDIVDLVCRMAASVLIAHRANPDGSDLSTKRIQSERAGEYSVSYAYAGLVSEQELPDYLRARLAARFGGGPATVVRSR